MITSQISKAGPYAADGVQRIFPFGFRVMETSHLTVYRNDSPVPTADYTVTLTDEGGNVVFGAAPASGDTVAIIRDVPATQEMDLQNNTAFLPEELEKAFDKITMMVQQLREVCNRTLTVPPTQEIDKETLFEEFQELAENAEAWATSAQAGASSAAASAQAASGSSDTARSHADSAENAASNAVSAAGSAANAASNAITAADDIRTISEQATLNRVTLTFGDWSEDDEALVSYDEWTDAESLISISGRIAAHDADAAAHSAAIALHDESTEAHSDIRTALSEHADSETAHSDIRAGIAEVDARFNNTEIRTLANTRCWVSPLITPVSGTRSTVTHGLNLSADELARAKAEVRLQCVVRNTSNGYEVGDYAQWGMRDRHGLVQPLLNADTVSIITGSAGIALVSKKSGGEATATLSQWRYEFRIWY